MTKRIGFDEGHEEEQNVFRQIFQFSSWALKAIILRAFDFKGRTRLPIFLIQFVTLIAVIVLALIYGLESGQEPFDEPIVAAIYVSALLLLIPVIVRRAHDLGWSVWSVANIFSPYVSAIKFLGLFVKPGSSELNNYGTRQVLSAREPGHDSKKIG